MTKKYILAIDQGTTSCRAIIFNTAGKKIGTAQEEFTQYFPQEGWVEHDAEEIWEKQLQVIKQVIQESNIDPSEIGAAGITNQRETTVVWDRNTGKPIHNAIVWQDRRTAGYCDTLKTPDLIEKVKQKTGLIIDAYFSATKVKYILDHVDGSRAKAKKGELCFGTIDSWLIYNLTNRTNHYTDITNASRTMLYNIESQSWDKELMALFDIPEQMLPEVVDCDGNFGDISEELIGTNIPIRGVAGDQQAALFGQLCWEPGMAKNTYGTGCFLVMNTGDSIVDSKNKLLSTVAWKVGGKINYALEGSVFIGGAAIQWLRDGLKILDSSNDSQKLAESVNDNGGIVFVPALSGLGAPHWDQYARGLIVGITRATTDAHIARAALESIALQVKDLITAMNDDMQAPLSELRVDGGAVANTLLMQLQSTFLQTKIIQPQEQETTALGAALLAGLGSKMFNSRDEIKKIWNINKEYLPHSLSENDLKLFRMWDEAIKRSKNWIN